MLLSHGWEDLRYPVHFPQHVRSQKVPPLLVPTPSHAVLAQEHALRKVSVALAERFLRQVHLPTRASSLSAIQESAVTVQRIFALVLDRARHRVHEQHSAAVAAVVQEIVVALAARVPPPPPPHRPSQAAVSPAASPGVQQASYQAVPFSPAHSPQSMCIARATKMAHYARAGVTGEPEADALPARAKQASLHLAPEQEIEKR